MATDSTNTNSTVRIYQQIEATADYYDPGVYFDLLTQHAQFELSEDPLTFQFIPLSTAQNTWDSKYHIFAIGCIPPAAVITDRQLDRSASIADNLDGNSGTAADLPASRIASANAAYAANNAGPKTTSDPNFWPQYVVMCNRLGVAPEELAKVINGESGFIPSAKAVSKIDSTVQAQGLNALTHATAIGLGMTEDEWQNLGSSSATSQLKWVEKYFAIGDRARGKTGEQLYITNFHPASFRNPNGSLYDRSIPGQKRSYDENAWLDKDRKGYITEEDTIKGLIRPLPQDKIAAIRAAQRSLGMGAPEQVRTVGADVSVTTVAWKDSGSKDASNAAQTAAQNAKSDLNATALGNEFRLQQVRSAANLNASIQSMASLPPLRLLVNPQSLAINNEKIIADGSRSRQGVIVEQWGDGQDTLEVSGKIGAFYSADVAGLNSELSDGGPGLNRSARQFSASYQNFLSLYQIYRNNAGIYISDDADPAKARTNLALSGSIYIYYDHIMYIGSFDSFSITETDQSPFTLEFSFQFTVRATFLLDQVPDPKFTYGQTSLNVNQMNSNSNKIQVTRPAPELRNDQIVTPVPVSADLEGIPPEGI